MAGEFQTFKKTVFAILQFQSENTATSEIILCKFHWGVLSFRREKSTHVHKFKFFHANTSSQTFFIHMRGLWTWEKALILERNLFLHKSVDERLSQCNKNWSAGQCRAMFQEQACIFMETHWTFLRLSSKHQGADGSLTQAHLTTISSIYHVAGKPLKASHASFCFTFGDDFMVSVLLIWQLRWLRSGEIKCPQIT